MRSVVENDSVEGRPETRLVGSRVAQDGAFPYQASVQTIQNSTHICGGVVIQPKWILSAAHCFESAGADQIEVLVGTISLSSGGTRYRVEKIVTHEDFSETSRANDIALLKLQSDLTYNSKVAAISLASRDTPVGTEVTLTGWGYVNPSEEKPDTLRLLYLNTISKEECQRKLEDNIYNPITDLKICADKGGTPGVGACQEDAGGPVMAGEELIGIISYGVWPPRDVTLLGPCGTGLPDVFTRVYAYSDPLQGPPETRLVGGNVAQDGAFPYQASVQTIQNRTHFCGGVVIQPKWILSAAHCFESAGADQIEVLVGTNTLSSGGTRYGVEKIIKREDFTETSRANDIALLKLQSDLTYNSKVAAISLASQDTPVGTEVTLTGWGYASPSERKPDNLRVLKLNTISTEECQRKLEYNRYNPITDLKICADKGGARVGACQEDSGGPVMAGDELIGIISYGVWPPRILSITPSCGFGRPDVFTRVYAYREWITDTIETNNDD
ncbi:unnamed protein product [Colias eurytheme]|nr:unnamed protein product [Colias eurytheme]